MSKQAAEIYDALAPHYREYAEKKQAYISAVDCFIREHVPGAPRNLLDVGAGDGIRGMALASQLGVRETVLCDISAEMVLKCRQLMPTEVWLAPAEELPATERRFDLITCLWNVLGHLPGRSERVRALSRMAELLSEQGVIFFDVNNRHNAAAYGRLRIFGRVVIDAVLPDERRGDASFDWRVGDRIFPAMGHLFTPAEIEGIITESGLQVEKRIAVDYATGRSSTSRFDGQLVYLVRRRSVVA